MATSIAHLLDRTVRVYDVSRVDLGGGRWSEDVSASASSSNVRCRFSSPSSGLVELGLRMFGQVVETAYFEPGAAIITGQVIEDQVNGRRYDVREPAGDNPAYAKWLVSRREPSQRSHRIA